MKADENALTQDSTNMQESGYFMEILLWEYKFIPRFYESRQDFFHFPGKPFTAKGKFN